MNEPDQTTNSLDRSDQAVSIDPDRLCISCQTPIKFIIFRPFPLCTECLYELADRLDEARSEYHRSDRE
jgi:predicted amidophosphoribosyltransferase